MDLGFRLPAAICYGRLQIFLMTHMLLTAEVGADCLLLVTPVPTNARTSSRLGVSDTRPVARTTTAALLSTPVLDWLRRQNAEARVKTLRLGSPKT